MHHSLTPEVPLANTAAARAEATEVQKKATDHLYWARSSSANAAPPPKSISAEEAQKLAEKSSSAGGSAWNSGGNTWEEKKINAWAIETLKQQLLPQISYDLPSAVGPLPTIPQSPEVEGASRVHARVLSADVKGECTYVLSRGKQRVVFELEFKLELEIEVFANDELKTILSGKLNIPEITNDELGDAKLPSCKCICEQAGMKPFFESVAKLSWPALRTQLEALVEESEARAAKGETADPTAVATANRALRSVLTTLQNGEAQAAKLTRLLAPGWETNELSTFVAELQL